MKTFNLPSHAPDWQGNQRPVSYPDKTHDCIAQCGSISLWRAKHKTRNGSFLIVCYGLQNMHHADSEQGMNEFRDCVQHELDCEDAFTVPAKEGSKE